MIFKRSKKGMLDEIMDDVFAFFLIFITFLFVFLLYQNTTKDTYVTYETSIWETKTTQALNYYLQYPINKDNLDVADIIMQGEAFEKDEVFKQLTNQELKKYVQEAQWELTFTYYTGSQKTHTKRMRSGKAPKTIAAISQLPTKEGKVIIELRVQEPKYWLNMLKYSI